MMGHLIIIGGVAAGTKAASKARRENPDLKITLYTDEKHISYSACGLPYYIQGVIKDENRLLVRSPQEFKEKENIDIITSHRVTKIMPDQDKVEVLDIESGETFEDEYDRLLIATGSRSFIPDEIEGTGTENVFKLKSVEDGFKIRQRIDKAKKVVIVGAGYIGMELAEAFHENGIETTVIERTDQVLTTFDSDLAYQIQRHLVDDKNVKVITGECINRIIPDENNKAKAVETTKGHVLEADTVILALGVKPNSELAADAGIEVGETGAIKTNKRMQTSVPNIYAAGDCAETIDRITGKPAWVPLGSTANKQGRIAAINITGGYAEFGGVLGSLVVKVFDYTASKTGLNEREARELGYDYEVAIVPHRDKSGYMPDVADIIVKLIAEKRTGKILGGQVIGEGDADKRVNVIATALTANMTVEEFMQTDLTYAPPYSPAIDPVLVAAQILQNKLEKNVDSISPQEFQKMIENDESCCVVDIRNPNEYKVWHLNQAENLSQEELEKKIAGEKPENLVLYCEEGMQSYLSSLKLKECGCVNVKFIDGGINFYRKISESIKKEK